MQPNNGLVVCSIDCGRIESPNEQAEAVCRVVSPAVRIERMLPRAAETFFTPISTPAWRSRPLGTYPQSHCQEALREPRTGCSARTPCDTLQGYPTTTRIAAAGMIAAVPRVSASGHPEEAPAPQASAHAHGSRGPREPDGVRLHRERPLRPDCLSRASYLR